MGTDMIDDSRDSADANQISSANELTPVAKRNTSPRDCTRNSLDAIKPEDVQACVELHDKLDRIRQNLGLKSWRALENYLGPIPSCVKNAR
jgi:hypothetical protein